MVITMTAGTAVIMWLGELITDRGVGNGMSLLIFTSIASRFPAEGRQHPADQRAASSSPLIWLSGLAIIAAVVFVEQAQRRIPVQYAKRMVGRRMYGGTSTYIPLKVNQAGVIPVIFASSLLYLPQLLGQLSGQTDHAAGSGSSDATSSSRRPAALHASLYFLLIIFFTYFYVSITFNPTRSPTT